VITEAMQGAGIVAAIGIPGGLLMWKWMQSEAKPPELTDYSLPTVAIQPDGSVYVRPDKPRLGGATVAPRLRKEGR
jgi:hypothetical protein